MPILTTHTGSLPRLVTDGAGGLREPASPDEAVSFAVREQLALGLDVVGDGEMARPSYVGYLGARVRGLTEGEPARLPSPDLAAFPGFTPPFTGTAAPRSPTLHCTGPIEYTGTAALRHDVTLLGGLLGGRPGFLTAPSPGTVAMFMPNDHYPDRRGYLDALAAALRVEYRAIRLARAGKRLAPGVIDSTTNYIEHPELVAKRLRNVIRCADTEDVLATTDCGFGCVAGHYLVDPRIAWAKLRALVEGAALVA